MIMIRLKLSISLWYEIASQASDFIFKIFMHANESSNGGDRESGYLPPLMAVVYPDPTCGICFTRLKAEPGIGNSLCRYGEY